MAGASSCASSWCASDASLPLPCVADAGTPGAGLFDSPTRPLALALYASPLATGVIAQGLAKLPFNAAEFNSLTVTIYSPEAGQPRVTSEARLTLMGGSAQQVTFRSNLMPRSSVALREDFVEAEALGQRGLLPGPLAVSRSLYVAYLDDDLLVLRDDSGLPTVLRRAPKFPEAPADSTYDDESAPGAG